MKFENSNKARLIENETPYISFPALEQYSHIVKHGFSTRLGGVSEGNYSSLNLSFSRGDDEDKVRENFRRISKSIGIEADDLVISDQVHKTNIRKVTKEDLGKGFIRPRDYAEIDGLITNEVGVPLVTAYADCVPLYFLDPVKKAIGLTHSGWRGTVGKIGKKTVEEMQREFNCDPKDIIAVIGPSICEDCYEISKEVADKFIEAFSYLNEQQGTSSDNDLVTSLDQIVQTQADYYKKSNCKAIPGKDKYQLNLWNANYAILREAGLLPEHIHSSEVCTCCNWELLYSHRASNGLRGGLCAFLQLA